MSAAREVVRWTSSATLVLAGIFCLYLALFHAWVSATPTPTPELHRSLFYRFGLVALFCFLLAGVVFGCLGRRSGDRPARRGTQRR